MSYTITQNLVKYPENENVWEDHITSDNEAGYFIAVTGMTIEEGAAQRNVTVQMFPMSLAPEVNETQTGAYVRQEKETSVKAVLLNQKGEEVASNVAEYPG